MNPHSLMSTNDPSADCSAVFDAIRQFEAHGVEPLTFAVALLLKRPAGQSPQEIYERYPNRKHTSGGSG